MKPILVAEDDENIRESLMMILAYEGFQVVPAADGQEALDWLGQGGEPGLILLDMMMPRLDGWTFLERWRKMPASSRCPVLVLSGADLRPGLPGAEAVLRKPVSVDELLGMVRQHLA